MYDAGFVRSKLEPTFLEERFYERFDLLLEQLVGVARNDEVVRKPYQVDLGARGAVGHLGELRL
jgi:hypothetical protein